MARNPRERERASYNNRNIKALFCLSLSAATTNLKKLKNKQTLVVVVVGGRAMT
jgi:hypothetical protein